MEDGGKVRYMLNGWPDNLNYILDSTDGVEVAREFSRWDGVLVIFFETKDTILEESYHEEARNLMQRLDLKYNRETLMSLDEYFCEFTFEDDEKEEIINLLEKF